MHTLHKYQLDQFWSLYANARLRARLCNLLFCWRLQEPVAVHVPARNMIQQGGKTMRQCAGAAWTTSRSERGGCAINRYGVKIWSAPCTDRSLYRIHMCLHVGRRAWEACERALSFWAVWVECWHESGQTPLPPSSHGLSHLICQWSILTAAAAVCVCVCVCVCVWERERETMSASMYVCNQQPICILFALAYMRVCVCVCVCVCVLLYHLMKCLSDIWSSPVGNAYTLLHESSGTAQTHPTHTHSLA